MARRRLLTLTAATLGASLLALPASAGPLADLVRDLEEAARPVTTVVEDVTGEDVVGDVLATVVDATTPVDQLLEEAAGESSAPAPAEPVTTATEVSEPVTAPEVAPAPSPGTVQAAGVGDPTAFDPLMLGKSRRDADYDPLANVLAPRTVETPQVAAPESAAPAMVELAAAPTAAPAPAAAPGLGADADRPVGLELLALAAVAGTAVTWQRRRSVVVERSGR